LRFPEYDSLDALALANLVRRREVTALEVLEAALERADRRNGRLNAIVARFDDEARALARRPLPPGPLSGVPFLLKDLLTAWKDHPITGSSRLGEGFRPDHDSEVVRRLKAGGLVLFGLTNAAELGILAHTEPALHGPCRNPWNIERTPGGSSGGSAAAVAARIVPAAHGNDGGGSLRIPASHCGLFGLKSTRGRVSLAPDASEIWGGLVVEGVMTRSVRDGAAFLDLLAGPVAGDPPGPPAPARPFVEEVGRPPGALRVAVTTGSFFGHGTHPEAIAATEEAARLLRELGHVVEEARPPVDRERMVKAYLRVIAADVASEVDELARRTGRRPSASTLEPETAGLVAAGRAFSAVELKEDLDAMRRLARDLGAFFERWDLLLTPAVAAPPMKVGSLRPKPWERLALRAAAASGLRSVLSALFDRVGDRSFDATGFTMPFNQTGQPACSVPLHLTADGLPLGVQLVGRFGEEATLIRVAAQLESARPWNARKPSGLRGG
jgi:amidase